MMDTAGPDSSTPEEYSRFPPESSKDITSEVEKTSKLKTPGRIPTKYPDGYTSLILPTPTIMRFTPINKPKTSSSASVAMGFTSDGAQWDLASKGDLDSASTGSCVESFSDERTIDDPSMDETANANKLSAESLKALHRNIANVKNYWGLDLSKNSPVASLFTTKGQRIGVGSSSVLAALAKKYRGCGVAVVAALQTYARDNEKGRVVRSNIAEIGWTLMKKARKEFETRTTQFEKGNYEETVESLSDEELNERREGKDYEEMSRRFDADVARAEEGDGEDVDDDADEKLGHHEQDYGSGAALPEIADSEDERDDTEERAYEIIKTTN